MSVVWDYPQRVAQVDPVRAVALQHACAVRLAYLANHAQWSADSVVAEAALFEDYLRNGSGVKPVDGPAPFVD